MKKLKCNECGVTYWHPKDFEYAEGRAEPPMRWPIKIRTDHGKKCYLCQ